MLTILSRLCFFVFSLVVASIFTLFFLSLASGKAEVSYTPTTFTNDTYSFTTPFSRIISGFNTGLQAVSTETQSLANSLSQQTTYIATSVTQVTTTTIHFIARTPGTVVHNVASAMNIKALIQPAGELPTPIIRPSSVELASYIAPSSPPVSVNPEPQPQPSPTASDPVNVTVSTPQPKQIQTANLYAWGNCTWWAASRRAQINAPIPGSWGNAATWAVRAVHDGYVVDHHPSAGAIMQTPNSAGGLGHVAFVEQVDPDGTWHISEMNVIGLNVVDHKAEPASAAVVYNFIHSPE